jgi:peroxiredoxin
MPGIQNLYDKVDTSNIKFVLISLDDTPDRAIKFIERRGFNMPFYFPAGRLPEVYRSDLIPTTFVISPEGRIVSKTVGMADYDRKSFRKFLDKLIRKPD